MNEHAIELYTALDLALRELAAPLHDRMVMELVGLRARGGRLFCLGVGGGAANAAHAAADFRKLCEIEAYAPTDNTAEFTARINDDGWDRALVDWLRVSKLSDQDAVFVFSVGGGTPEVSACIYWAVQHADSIGAVVMGVVGLPDGAACRCGDAVAAVGLRGSGIVTPVTESAQLAVLHALVTDPRLRRGEMKW